MSISQAAGSEEILLNAYEFEIEDEVDRSEHNSSGHSDEDNLPGARRGMNPEASQSSATPKTTSTSSALVDTEIMDSCDSIADDGNIVWGYLLRSTNSMKAVSAHLRMPEADGYAALKALTANQTIKAAVEQLMSNTKENKHTWKPNTMIRSIQDDKTGSGKYSLLNSDTDKFTAYDWYCYTLETIKVVLCAQGGPFHLKSRADEYLYNRAWSLIRFMRWNASIARQKKRALPSSADSQSPPKRQRLDESQEEDDEDNNIRGSVPATQSVSTTSTAELRVLVLDIESTSLGNGISNVLTQTVMQRPRIEGDSIEWEWEAGFVQRLVASLMDAA